MGKRSRLASAFPSRLCIPLVIRRIVFAFSCRMGDSGLCSQGIRCSLGVSFFLFLFIRVYGLIRCGRVRPFLRRKCPRDARGIERDSCCIARWYQGLRMHTLFPIFARWISTYVYSPATSTQKETSSSAWQSPNPSRLRNCRHLRNRTSRRRANSPLVMKRFVLAPLISEIMID